MYVSDNSEEGMKKGENHMGTVIEIIFMGIVPAFIYEMLKYIVVEIKDKIKMKSIPFSLEGYWCSCYDWTHPISGTTYSAFELIKMNYHKDRIEFLIYQITTDSRHYIYKGSGYIRGNRISLTYQDASNEKSNKVGAFLLKSVNVFEHSICLIGSYMEFYKESNRGLDQDYMLIPCSIDNKNKLKFKFVGKKSIFSFMKGKDFQNECREKMQKMRDMLSR